MDTERLYEILTETTCQLRKGEAVDGSPELVAAINAGAEQLPGGVAEIYAMPPMEAAGNLEKADVEFIFIGVDKVKAEARRPDLIALLDAYPDPERLAAGPSYIEVGATLGDQGAAFLLFALGKVLGLWDIITPASLGFSGEEARMLAGSGFVMISGYKRQEEERAV